MAKAPVEREITFKGYEDVKAGIVKWPMSVIRISATDKDRLIDLADKILLAWRATRTRRHSFTPRQTASRTIQSHRSQDGAAMRMSLDLVLRNNITTEEHPLGVYHPHAKASSYQEGEYRSDRGYGSGSAPGTFEG